jgi:hypothetical protein
MNIQQKKELALTPRKLTFEGVPCKVAGWANDYATITADFAGFYQARWEKVKEVIESDGNFRVEDVTLTNMRWKGTGMEMPQRVREWFHIPETVKK